MDGRLEKGKGEKDEEVKKADVNEGRLDR